MIQTQQIFAATVMTTRRPVREYRADMVDGKSPTGFVLHGPLVSVASHIIKGTLPSPLFSVAFPISLEIR